MKCRISPCPQGLRTENAPMTLLTRGVELRATPLSSDLQEETPIPRTRDPGQHQQWLFPSLKKPRHSVASVPSREGQPDPPATAKGPRGQHVPQPEACSLEACPGHSVRRGRNQNRQCPQFCPRRPSTRRELGLPLRCLACPTVGQPGQPWGPVLGHLRAPLSSGGQG